MLWETLRVLFAVPRVELLRRQSSLHHAVALFGNGPLAAGSLDRGSRASEARHRRRRRPSSGWCQLRASLTARDGSGCGAARERLLAGLTAGGGPKSGHAWLESERTSRTIRCCHRDLRGGRWNTSLSLMAGWSRPAQIREASMGDPVSACGDSALRVCRCSTGCGDDGRHRSRRRWWIRRGRCRRGNGGAGAGGGAGRRQAAAGRRRHGGCRPGCRAAAARRRRRVLAGWQAVAVAEARRVRRDGGQ